MKRSLLIILILCGYVLAGRAQQYPETSLYSINPYLINPGFTGYLSDLSGYVSARSPLSVQENEIRSYRVGLNQAIEKSNIGIGGKLTYDQRDFFESVYVDFSFAYKIVMGNKRVFSLGTDIGIVNRSYNLDNLSSTVDLTDPTLSSDYYYKTNFKMGIGLAYYSTHIEAGIAMPYMLEGSENLTTYFNAYLAYKHYFSHDEWLLKPNLYWVTYPDATDMLNVSLMVERRDKFWGQLGATTTKELLFAMGFKFQIYELSYSYAHNIEGNQPPYKSSNEIMLRIHYGKSNKVIAHIATKQNRKGY
ncbi:type IX secretion system membrane protein PorP/SprF [Reichenbachiella agarivorans]|uniref:Type IX secretion system membrane protein PorP/SprF n=1 Tax=Reichenbachiella agarivorans TaxID=2979464 RepID=A0ABY6CX22_9BACT|nr:type IX secretion system membrane protein PorP/SprF [Reichenbachiella agarivorans]UXP33943.1 type IX secretion system membrane protein PorP/SprF [Reichenbachiella agarivorans]